MGQAKDGNEVTGWWGGITQGQLEAKKPEALADQAREMRQAVTCEDERRVPLARLVHAQTRLLQVGQLRGQGEG